MKLADLLTFFGPRESKVELLSGGSPTEANKRSPSGYYTEAELLKFSRQGFPKEVLRYQISNTNSMEPWIDAGDIALVKPLSASEEPVLGEVYVYDNGSFLIIHRLVAVNNGKYIFRGDNNFSNDSWRPEKKHIVGHVFAVLWGKKQKGD